MNQVPISLLGDHPQPRAQADPGGSDSLGVLGVWRASFLSNSLATLGATARTTPTGAQFYTGDLKHL